jgi:hypothetical protein
MPRSHCSASGHLPFLTKLIAETRNQLCTNSPNNLAASPSGFLDRLTYDRKQTRDGAKIMAINLTSNGWNGTQNGSWSNSADIINDQTEATSTKPKGIINLDTSIITGSGDIENRINTGGGDDWMRGQGFDIGIHNESFNKLAIIDTGAGNDVLYGISKTNLEKRISAGVWNNGHIYTGLGNDTIRGDADTNYGIYITLRNRIDTGEGNDRIIGITKGLTNNAVGIFVGGSITTGDGDDQIVGRGVTGIRNWQDQQISTGSGKDILECCVFMI